MSNILCSSALFPARLPAHPSVRRQPLLGPPAVAGRELLVIENK
jgi:hypothetical protein